MKHISFEVDADGFHGAYWPCRGGSACAVIAMLGDDAADYMARSAVKWLMKLGVNVMTMSPGKKDGCKEWPIAGESLFSYHGKPLPYMPFCYQHPQYWQVIAEETRQSGDMLASRKLFDDSEAAHPITEDAYIKVENIRGRLLLIGAADDSLWDTAKYIRRKERRLAEKPHDCTVETAVYAHGTHFVFPEGMLKTILPIGSGLFMKLAFRAAKQFPEACRQTRMDIDRRITAAIQAWRTAQ